ncbi:hypothetical protein Ddye_000412 [Dipteronia dyeriana]|uniref:DNA repair protein UVH3 n=1 Tax=Dipteronia dyeriana TaxID=168575 RepID=A0AAD9XMX2_9ROSI|nr:hypothetical protein Ddye_000412 [Dipteronia dyeriana]
MGVHGLWDLLAPVGRRVSVETLAGKKLAIDASIWMVQFMKAMRDDKGEMVRNAHLLGFFRRICKLLYLKTKPVFVFDGATPALKRRTVIARRRQRENAQTKIRKTAEKLLINQLKTMRLKELAKDLENQKKQQKNHSKGKMIMPEQIGLVSNAERNSVASTSGSKTNRQEMLAASIATDDDKSLTKKALTVAAVSSEVVDWDEDEEMIIPTMDGNVDPAVFDALPTSIQYELLAQKNNAKGKKILSNDPGQASIMSSDEGSNHVVPKNHDHIKLDEMLAASIAAEEYGSSINNVSTSAASIPFEEEDIDEDEEIILPAMDGSIDPAVLASLPPSMQLDLLVQMRERLMAENRQKYQEVKKAPEKFSELQIKAYLKTVAFRREIDEVQKTAAGRGVGGVQTSRIASEANREFIFSSSFTGDKQVLASARVERNGDMQQQTPSKQPSLDSMTHVAPISKSNALTVLSPDEPRRDLDGDVETYLDERGRIRVSRVRAMGLRMTRDLQRNLDMMKAVENERTKIKKTRDVDSMLNLIKKVTPTSFSKNSKFVEASHDSGSESINLIERTKQSMFKSENSIEISFEDSGENKSVDDDDDNDLFACLAASNPVINFYADNTQLKKQSSGSFSDSDWEEGFIEGKDNSFSGHVNAEIAPHLNVKVGNISDESEMEWEEGPSVAPKSSSSCQAKTGNTISRGYLEEEANLQEAIRISLLHSCSKQSNHVLSEDEKYTDFGQNAYGDRFIDEENNMGGPNLLGENVTRQNESFCEIVGEADKLDALCGNFQVNDSLDSQLKISVVDNPDNKRILTNKSCERYFGFHSKQPRQDSTEKMYLYGDAACAESVTMELNENHFVKGKFLDTSNEDAGLSSYAKKCSDGSLHNTVEVFGDVSDSILSDHKKTDSEAELSILVDNKKKDPEAEPSIIVDDKKNDFEVEQLCHAVGIRDPSILVVDASTNESLYDIDIEKQLAAERAYCGNLNARELNIEKSAIKEIESTWELTEASLEEEMLVLDQECSNLGDEQRKLECNAESVSGEMFAECQELLQMFGLPYIIAPMEAEAQCASMELANLVDGVVTDDSDVFLFGARSVYKNIFDERKYVETYFMQDIEKELGLTREKLIRMALLLGSDYTEGISGIGIVNAIEVVNAFPEDDGLHKFREWIESPDPSILGKLDVQTGSNARKRGLKGCDNDMNHAKGDGEEVSEFNQNIFQADENKQSADHSQNIKKIFMNKHRNVSKNWHISSTFPSEAVISAYICPQVDKSTEPFSWGKPDRFVLRKFCWDKFAWGIEKLDELLLPVLNEYGKRETQLRLEAFYTFNERFAKIRSKRIKKAVKGITGDQLSKLMNDAVQELPKSRKKRRASHPEGGSNKSEKLLMETVESDTGCKYKNIVKSAPKQSRKRRVPEKFVSYERESPEPSMQADGGQSTYEVLHGGGRGRGCRFGRGRGRGKGKGKLGAELSETRSCDGIGGNGEHEAYAEKLKWPQEVRRSTRSLKPVNYRMNDPEIDDESKTSSDKDYTTEEAVKPDLFGVGGMLGDDSAHLDGRKQHKSGDPPHEVFSSDLERGGGFCVDEGETDQSTVRQNEDPFSVAEVSKDYLKMGGGFCAHDSEIGENQGAVQNSTTNEDDANTSPFFEFVEKVDPIIGSGDSFSSPRRALNGLENDGSTDRSGFEVNLGHQNATTDNNSNADVSMQENVKSDSANVSAGVLTAMPFLKKKRRKS